MSTNPTTSESSRVFAFIAEAINDNFNELQGFTSGFVRAEATEDGRLVIAIGWRDIEFDAEGCIYSGTDLGAFRRITFNPKEVSENATAAAHGMSVPDFRKVIEAVRELRAREDNANDAEGAA